MLELNNKYGERRTSFSLEIIWDAPNFFMTHGGCAVGFLSTRGPKGNYGKKVS